MYRIDFKTNVKYFLLCLKDMGLNPPKFPRVMIKYVIDFVRTGIQYLDNLIIRDEVEGENLSFSSDNLRMCFTFVKNNTSFLYYKYGGWNHNLVKIDNEKNFLVRNQGLYGLLKDRNDCEYNSDNKLIRKAKKQKRFVFWNANKSLCFICEKYRPTIKISKYRTHNDICQNCCDKVLYEQMGNGVVSSYCGDLCICCRTVNTAGICFEDDGLSFNMCQTCMKYYFELMDKDESRKITDPVLISLKQLICEICKEHNFHYDSGTWIAKKWMLIPSEIKDGQYKCYCEFCWRNDINDIL